MGVAMANNLSEEKALSEAFSIIEHTPDTQVVIDKLRYLLKVDHVVYSEQLRTAVQCH
jgi:hypothetical protein